MLIIGRVRARVRVIRTSFVDAVAACYSNLGGALCIIHFVPRAVNYVAPNTPGHRSAIATAGSESASGLGTIINYTTSAHRRGARNRPRYVPALLQIEKSPRPKTTLPPSSRTATDSLTPGLFRYSVVSSPDSDPGRRNEAIRALTTGQASVNTVISIVDVSRQTDKQGGEGRKEES
jgi:hypothetical protein